MNQALKNKAGAVPLGYLAEAVGISRETLATYRQKFNAPTDSVLSLTTWLTNFREARKEKAAARSKITYQRWLEVTKGRRMASQQSRLAAKFGEGANIWSEFYRERKARAIAAGRSLKPGRPLGCGRGRGPRSTNTRAARRRQVLSEVSSRTGIRVRGVEAWVVRYRLPVEVAAIIGFIQRRRDAAEQQRVESASRRADVASRVRDRLERRKANTKAKRIKVRHRCVVWKAMTGARQGDKTVRKWVGCGTKELRQHIEQQFIGCMKWENYSKAWTVDHVFPLSAFNLFDERERRQVFHFSNLKPVWRKTNLRKSDKITDPQLKLLL